MEPQVAAHLLPDVEGHLDALQGVPLPELQARCGAQGLAREGAAAELKLRLAMHKLQEVGAGCGC